jgi:hypothetical protein
MKCMKLTFYHDYKIGNDIQVYTMQTITTSGVLHLNAANKPSSISKDARRFESIVNLAREII